MNPEIREYIARSDYYRGSVQELGKLLPADDAALDGLIAETVAENDQLAFIFVAMAALCAGRPVQARHLARGTSLMPEKFTLGTIASHMAGDIATPLLEAVTEQNFAIAELASTALYLAANWHQEQGEGWLPARLIAAARVAARDKRNSPYDNATLHAIGLMGSDAGLIALTLKSRRVKPGKAEIEKLGESAVLVGKEMLKVWRRAPIEILAGAPSKTLAAGGTMRRAVARVGRNAPCPCGSGRKYKHCCAEKDQGRLHHSTSIAGLTAAELRANPEPYLTALDFETRPPHEIARLDALKIDADLLEHYLAYLCRAKQLDAAVVAWEKLGYRDELRAVFNAILVRAAQAQRKDVVDRMLKLPPDLSKVRTDAVELFLDEGDPAKLVAFLQEEAIILVAHNELHHLKSFPRMLLKSRLCALGILVARGAIPLLPPVDAAELLGELLQAHDQLSLSPDDPISDILDRLSVEHNDEGKDAAALREAQSRLQTKMQEVRQYREAVERLEEELARREKLAAAPAAPAMPAAPTDEAALKEMRQKVNALKSALKERHNERNELRRELQKAQTDLELLRQKTAAPTARSDSPEEGDHEEDLLLPQESDGNQPMRVIEFPRNFGQTLNGMPRHVARGALAMLGRVAGGEPAAFVGAVRLKACPSITRQRIGIDHRLLFRLLPDRVQVVDLIPRQDLERKIKTLV